MQQAASIQNLNLNNFSLSAKANDSNNHQALSFSQLNIENFMQQDKSFQTEEINLDKLNLLSDFEQKIKDQSHLISVNNINLSSLKYSQNNITLGNILIKKLSSYLTASDNGLNLQNWIYSNPNKNDSAPKRSSKQPVITINQFKVFDSSKIELTEQSTGKPITHKLNNIQLELSNINLGNQLSQTPPALINYQFGINETGTVDGKGELVIANDEQQVDIKGSLNAVNLVSLSDYAARFIGYRIEQGLLNTGYEVKIANKKIQANFETQLEKFELGDLQSHEKSALNEDLGIPLPTALNLLRDSNDNIDLSLPIDGDLASPYFSIASIITTVSGKAIKNAVIYHYSPLGMLTLASGIFDLATALNFEPIEFTPQNTALNEKAKQQLEKVISVMIDKPKIKMVVCGIGSFLDHESKSQNKNQTIDPLPLLKLAEQRQDNVVNYLVQSGKISQDRFIGCNVKMSDNPKEGAKVNLSL